MEENENVNFTNSDENVAVENYLSPEEQAAMIEKARFEQKLPFGIVAGLIAALVMAAAWAAITVTTEYQIGYMAIAVGFVVGIAVRYAGKGVDMIFGISGAILALIGCLLGNFLSQVGFATLEFGVPFFEALKTLAEPSIFVEIMKESFSGIDLLFYGIAIYEGYRFSFLQLSKG